MKPTRFVFASACLGMLLFGASFITLGSTAPYLQEKFSLSALEAGTVFSILPFGILGGSLVFGPIADRHGFKVILVVAGLLMALGFHGIAWSTDRTLLNASIFVFGFGGGIVNGACNAAVADVSVKKGANISLIGVFYAIGALGMPVILASLVNTISFEYIVSGAGYVALIVTLVFLLARFPAPKQSEGISFSAIKHLAAEPALLLIGFFLFCQSSFEGIVNNWTTTFLIQKASLTPVTALFALSLHVAGMAVMRLLMGGALRQLSPARLLIISMVCISTGILLLQFSSSFTIASAGLIVLGAGLAVGFPVMLGLAGELYASLSGTAFSIVLTMALIGNMLLNMAMGLIVASRGVHHLVTMTLALTVIMSILAIRIIDKTNRNNYAGKTMAQ